MQRRHKSFAYVKYLPTYLDFIGLSTQYTPQANKTNYKALAIP